MKKVFLFILIFIFLLSGCGNGGKQIQNNLNINDKNMAKQNLKIRNPVVAGQYYPDDSAELQKMINGFLGKAEKSPLPPFKKGDSLTSIKGDANVKKVKAIIVPHAGYVFSGEVAAKAFKQMEGQKVDNVIIICNSHNAYFDEIAVDDADAWETPLGKVELNKNLTQKIIEADPEIKYNNQVHKIEQTLEVELPFLQTVLGAGFKIVPVLFGNQSSEQYKNLSAALKESLGPNDVIVISTDMSHYPSYKDANKIDQQTLEYIGKGDLAGLEKHFKDTENKNIKNEQTLLCGIDGARTILDLANKNNWTNIEILNYKNSGDTAFGDKKSVVGYGAVAIYGNPNKESEKQKSQKAINELTKEQKQILLDIAKETVEEYVKTGKTAQFNIKDERLNQKEGAFVTLHKSGQLRGCIGQIVPGEDPLWKVVREMAIAAATEDNRFNPVSEKELFDLDYEISVLSAPKKINNWQDIALGRDGVIIKKGWNSGVFLPQVATETGWDLEEFLEQLCSQKAGLSPNCYKDPAIDLFTFNAQVFK